MPQVWRKYDQETADKFARRKAGEFLDPDLAKVLKEQEKRADRIKREPKDKQMFHSQPKRSRDHTTKVTAQIHQTSVANNIWARWIWITRSRRRY